MTTYTLHHKASGCVLESRWPNTLIIRTPSGEIGGVITSYHYEGDVWIEEANFTPTIKGQRLYRPALVFMAWRCGGVLLSSNRNTESNPIWERWIGTSLGGYDLCSIDAQGTTRLLEKSDKPVWI